MWSDPERALLVYTFFAGGTLEFGWARSNGGMSVGTNPLMARIRIPLSAGDYPDGWFVVSGKRSIVKLKSEFDAFGGDIFLPDWLRADCFEYHYKRLTQLKQ